MQYEFDGVMEWSSVNWLIGFLVNWSIGLPAVSIGNCQLAFANCQLFPKGLFSETEKLRVLEKASGQETD